MSKGNILLVSDEEKTIKEIGEFLQSLGYHTKTTSSVGEALKMVISENIDLIIADLYLPGINGIEFIEKVKEKNKDIPTIILSDYGTEISKEFALSKGAAAFLEKPFQLDKIEEVLKKILSKSKGSILVVDDHPELRETIKKVLQLGGYTVEEAENGKIAVDMVKVKDYDVVLMDIHMPEMNGIEATRTIKKIKPVTYIVIMSGEAEKEEIDKALEINPGHDACLHKPFDLSTFNYVMKSLKEESKEYKKKVLRSPLQKFKDRMMSTKEEIAKEIERKKAKVLQWVAVIIISLIIGLGATYFIEASRKYFALFIRIDKILEKVDKYEKQAPDLEKKLEEYKKYKE